MTALTKGTTTITATTTNGKSAECVVTVTEAEPEVPEMDFGLAESDIVGYATVSFVDNGIRLNSDLATMEAQYRTPLGTIVAETQVPFKAYDTIAAVTLRLLDALDISASYSGNENSGFYLSSIGNFTVGETTYAHFGEFDAGAGSGWMITQNDVFINKGASEFLVKDGDSIEWQYTCQLGADIGDTYSKAAVEAVEKLINDIGNVTLDSEDAIKAAREAYEKLAPVQQAAVSNYETLTAAEAALAALKASEADKAAANEVINLIEAIGDEITEASKDEIEAARAAYEALTEDQKKLVTNYDDLTAAEDYLELLARVDADIANICKTTGDYLAGKTIGTGSINGEWAALGLARSGRNVPASYHEAAVAYVKENISDGRLHPVKSTENSRLILALTAIGKDVTNVDGNNLLSGLNDLTYIGKQGVNGLIYALIALDSHDYTPVGITRDDLIAAILNKQLADGGWSLGNTSEVDLTAMAIQALAPYYSDADVIGTVTLDKENAITSARNAYNRLTTLQKNLVGATYLTKLTAAEAELAALKKAAADEAAASAVEQKISNIGTNITLDSESRINTARNAYNALMADQKALVSNYQTLLNAEAALDVLKSTVSVTFTLLGCDKHGTGETTVHTLAKGNLQPWIAAKTYKVKPGATVKDLFELALKEAGLTWKNPTGNYVESITRNGVTIGEFTNGKNSGWMYTLNGKHPNLGVAQQTLVNGDVVVFHYTDDYTKEEGSTSSGTTTSGNTTTSGTTNYITTTTTQTNTATAESVDRLIEDIGEEITLDSAAKIKAARAAYDTIFDNEERKCEIF